MDYEEDAFSALHEAEYGLDYLQEVTHKKRKALSVSPDFEASLPFQLEDEKELANSGQSNALLPSAFPAEVLKVEPKIQRVHYGIDIYTLMRMIPKKQPSIYEEPSFANASLFVDKYRPKRFLELIGDDRTNRLLLRWLKSWVSKSGPDKRILLIHGPPGLGKTTLAHVGTRQAGYTPVEINASDERTREVVLNRILSTVGTRSVKGMPAAVLIDEIDAADAGFIRALLELAEPKGNKKGQVLIQRPILAICNDVYATVLRPLRAYAEILHVKRPAPHTAMARLKSICAKEGILHDTGALTALIEHADADLRACLNLLESFSRLGDMVTRDRVQAMAQRDLASSALSLVRAVFSKTARYHESVISGDDHEKEVILAFANYPSQNCEISMADRLMDFLILPSSYYDSTLLAFHDIFASQDNHIQRSTADFDSFAGKLRAEELLENIQPSTPLLFQSFASRRSLATETLPFLNHILNPTIHHARGGVLPADRARLDMSVDAANAFDFRFIQMRNDEGALLYKIDPPLEELVTFVSLPYKSAPYTTRQLLATSLATKKPKNLKQTTPQKRKADDSKPLVVAKKDFFGRAVTQEALNKVPPSKTDKIKVNAWIKYHEGYSNAVRKPLSIAELLREM